MTVNVLGAYPLGDINQAASALSGLMAPVLAQLDLALTGGFGLGAAQADLAGQFNAALSSQVSLGLSLSNPIAALKASLQAAVQLQASIAATLALGLPVVSKEVGVSLSASLAISGALAGKLGGISALIRGALSVKLGAVAYLGDLSDYLGAGGIVLLSFGTPTPDTLGSVGGQLQSLFSAGLTGIGSGDQVYGVVLVTKAPSAWAAIQATLKTS